MFFRVKRVRGVDYLQLVENTRQDGRPRQIVHLSLGRVDILRGNGFFERLLENISAICGSGVFLSPSSSQGTLQLSRDKGLIGRILAQLIAVSGLRATVRTLAKQCGFPAVFRVLLMETLMVPERPSVDNRRLAALRGLASASSVSEDSDEVSAKIFLEHFLSSQAREKELFLCLRSADKPASAPSIARGMVLATVLTRSGTPIAFETCPSFLPLPELISALTSRLKSEFGCQRVIVTGERAMASPRLLASLEKSGALYVFPVHENRSLEATPVFSEELECHEIRPPAAFQFGRSGPRFIRVTNQYAAESDCFLRNLQIRRLEGVHSTFELSPPVATKVKGKLEVAEAWDGVSVFATNLLGSPESLASLFFVDQDTRNWANELADFGAASFKFETIPDNIDDILQGWGIVALLAHHLRHLLLTRLRERFDVRTSWADIRRALHNHQSVRVTKGGNSLRLSHSLDPIVSQIFEVLDLTPPNTIEATPSLSDEGEWKEIESQIGVRESVGAHA